MTNYFKSPFIGKSLKEQITNPNIIAGNYSYYSGYYHGHSFDDCVRYLNPDRNDVDKLIVGKFCSIGSGTVFMMAGNQGHRADWISTFPFFYQEEGVFPGAIDGYIRSGNTVIGNDVWIGTEAMIMPGVNIGDGAIIASRSIVTRDVAPYTVAGGTPAKELKKRFSPEDTLKLQEMHWWDWKIEQIRKAVPIFCSSRIDQLYDFWKIQVLV